jgi:hypothetical protein
VEFDEGGIRKPKFPRSDSVVSAGRGGSLAVNVGRGESFGERRSHSCRERDVVALDGWFDLELVNLLLLYYSIMLTCIVIPHPSNSPCIDARMVPVVDTASA